MSEKKKRACENLNDKRVVALGGAPLTAVLADNAVDTAWCSESVVDGPLLLAIASYDRIPADDAERKWTWLNGLLDARDPEYRAALPAVLKAVTEFVRQILAVHPLYARRR